jgi:hypothetical protein
MPLYHTLNPHGRGFGAHGHAAGPAAARTSGLSNARGPHAPAPQCRVALGAHHAPGRCSRARLLGDPAARCPLARGPKGSSARHGKLKRIRSRENPPLWQKLSEWFLREGRARP